MFPETKNTIFKNLHILTIFIVISLTYSSLHGYVSALLFANIIDTVNEQKYKDFIIFLSLFAIYIFMRMIIPNLNKLIFSYVRKKINNATSYDISNRINRNMLLSFEDEAWVEKFKRVCQFNSFVGDFIFTITTVFSQLCLFFSYVVFIYQYIGNHAYIYITILVPPLIKSGIFTLYYTKNQRKLNPDKQAEKRYFDIFTNPIAQSEAKLFNAGDFFYTQWYKKYKYNFMFLYKANKRFLPIHIIFDGIVAAIAIMTGLQLINLLSAGQISIGIVLTLIPFVLTIINSTDTTMQNFGSIFLTFYEYKEIIDLFKKFDEPGKDMLDNVDNICISLENVSFSYPNTKNNVLNNINLTIEQGKIISIVGVNGAGKSTLMKILAGFYKPSSGNVRLNGKDISSIDDHCLNGLISFLFQNPIKYPDTFYENVFTQGYSAKFFDDSMVANVDEDFKELLKSNNILVSGFFDSHNVSGGQWQKIAFLRSLQKESRIYFFDEPTASLDPIFEIEMFNLFKKFIKGFSTVFIATHRLGLARQADMMIIIDDTNIVGIGKHDELMQNCHVYNELYNMQSSWYDAKNL